MFFSVEKINLTLLTAELQKNRFVSGLVCVINLELKIRKQPTSLLLNETVFSCHNQQETIHLFINNLLKQNANSKSVDFHILPNMIGLRNQLREAGP